jgi:hypothetical protein
MTEVLSPFRAVGSLGYLVLSGLLAISLGAVWALRGRPAPPWVRLALRDVKRHPLLVLLATVVALGLVYEVALIVSTPPNNWDSMTYHLSRAAAWYQQGAVDYLPWAHTDRQNAFPPNSEILVLFTFAFLGRDTVAAAPQFLAELALLVGVYGIARRLGFSRGSAAFAALVFATLPQVALQSVTTQNDLLVSSFVVGAAYLILGRNRRELALAGLAIGLALGTKLTAVFALPVLLLLALVVLPRARLAVLLACAISGFTLVGAYGYALNLRETGSVLGRAGAEQEQFEPHVTLPGVASTAARTLYRFADFSGYPIDVHALNPLRVVASNAFETYRIPMNPPETTMRRYPFFLAFNLRANEDVSYFGPLGLLLLVPLTAAFVLAWIARRVESAPGVLALGLPLFVLILALTYRYTPWTGRFMLIPVALATPLVAYLYRFRLVSGLVALVAATTLGLTHAHNESKPSPLGPKPTAWSLPRIDEQTLARRTMKPVLATVDRLVGPSEPLGIALGKDDWDYPLYGAHLGRPLMALDGDGNARRTVAETNVDWALVRHRVLPRDAANGFCAVRSFPAEELTLLRRCAGRTALRVSSTSEALHQRSHARDERAKS